MNYSARRVGGTAGLILPGRDRKQIRSSAISFATRLDSAQS
jgi:hypothetical protein